MKQYKTPQTEVLSVQPATLLVTSSTPIDGGGEQIYAW